MTQDFPVSHGTPVPTIFFQALQQMLSGGSHNITLEQTAANVLRLPAGAGDAQASISIGNPTEELSLYRWVTEPLTVTITGAAGTYDIFACAAGADSYTSETDSTERKFTLAAVKAGEKPGSVYASRRIFSCVFDGTYITQLIPRLGQPLAALISAIIPSGLGPLPWSGAAAPSGWLICDGSAVAIATYPALFDAIGNTYIADYEAAHGSKPPAGQFALPDCRGRTMVGPDNMGATGAANRLVSSPKTAGAGGGEEKHTLSSTEMPVHGHTVNDPGHAHSLTQSDGVTFASISYVGGGVGGQTGSVEHSGYNNGFLGVSRAVTSITLGNAGGGAAHNNMQPYLVVENWIIKV